MDKKQILEIKNKTFDKFNTKLLDCLGDKKYKVLKLPLIDIFQEMWNDVELLIASHNKNNEQLSK